MTQTTRNPAKNQRGITLLEVMTVTAILLVMATLGTSQVVGVVRTSQEHASVAEVVGCVKEARSLARSLLTPTTLRVETRALIIEPLGRDPRSYTLGSAIQEVRFEDGRTSLTFDELGGLASATPVELEIVTASRKVQTVRIFPAIGAIRWGA